MGKWINRLKSEAGANIDVVADLIAAEPMAAVEEVAPGVAGIVLRRRPVDVRLQVRTTDAAEAVAQGGVAACAVSAHHFVPLIHHFLTENRRHEDKKADLPCTNAWKVFI